MTRVLPGVAGDVDHGAGGDAHVAALDEHETRPRPGLWPFALMSP